MRHKILAGSFLLPLAAAAAFTAPLQDLVDPLGIKSVTPKQAAERSKGCITCHTSTDARTMHAAESVVLGCADCHGGDFSITRAGEPGSASYEDAKRRAHKLPKNDEVFSSSANPEQSYTALLKEDVDFVRFMNPGDLRVAPLTCGPCHRTQSKNVPSSMMTHSAMLYGAALYNNGVLPGKDPIVGESYGPDGQSRMLSMSPPPTPEQTKEDGVLPALVPFPRWELGQPGNRFRVFERGGRRVLEVGLPGIEEEPGQPDKNLSTRGLGTLLRTDPLILGAQKSRLVDPLLSLLGTNDHPGDYRSSGCSACHVVYANDRSEASSGPYAPFGNRGRTQTVDPTIPKGESGHPLKHVFTSSIPTSQCMPCHMHPGGNMLSGYLGYTWWDNEVDGQLMYPKEPRKLSSAEVDRIQRANPEGAALRGKWSDREFLAEVSSLNDEARNTQFADFHGHGWTFRAVYKKDKKGRLLDTDGNVVPDDDPSKFDKAVHMMDIHLEKGMHCVDCHFSQDNHGTGKLYGEPRAAIEIDCVDCHGTVRELATLTTSGPASTGTNLADLETPWGELRFEDSGDAIVQRSMVTEGVEWTIPQVLRSITPGAPSYNEKARYAKTVRRGGAAWGDNTASSDLLAHDDSNMTCFACHTSWTTSCFGCHLSMTADEKKPNLHSEGGESRNYTTYNFQTLRDDIFFLARDGTVAGSRIAPARSACAVLVSSQNANREWIYTAQQTTSSGGFAGTAFSTFVPHTVRTTETQTCTSCHVSGDETNNAWMASVLMHGTGLFNWIGRYAYVATGRDGLEAVVVSEREEPGAVIGSRLHQLAYPDRYREHLARGRRLETAYGHGGNVRSLQLRGEYLFAAEGGGGLRIYDVAQVDQKGFSERIVSAPVSPLGQKLYVKTRDATSVVLPATSTIDPGREVAPENEEQRIHPIYSYGFVTDAEEGLVVVGPLSTLLDGEPRNNFIDRAATFNPDGALSGASTMALAGTVGYVATPSGLVVVDLDRPTSPRILTRVSEGLRGLRAIAVQFRFAIVTDRDGLKVLDITLPDKPALVPGASVPIGDARGLYLARTYAYVAAGPEGLVLVDIESPRRPRRDQTFDAGGAMNDTYDVKIGMTAGSAFAYVADGRNGLRVVQIISANDTPGAYGFSPRPTPELVATYKTSSPALAVSRGIDRDRAVDELGNQIGVFGRRGARPFNAQEQRRMYLRDGKLYTVTNEPSVPASKP